MNRISLFQRAFLISFVATGIHTARAEGPQWQGKMKGLADIMGNLLPELVSNNPDPKVIETSAKSLAELSHDLKEGRKSGKMMPPSDGDPSLVFLAEQFSEQSRRAYAAIQRGQLNYGKNLLRSTTAYCIACHTRHENGPEFATFPLSKKADTLGKEEKGELFVATRQFDKALGEFQSLVSDQELLKSRVFEWERPLRHALAIAVRVKKDPALAAKTVELALKSTDLPDFERNQILKWQSAIESWKKEPAVKTNTEEGYVAEMRRLFKEATNAQFFPVDHSAEIQYLRASGAAHDVLRVSQNPKNIAEALMTAGTSYEVLANPAFWPMHEFYYEACIRKYPHSNLASDCYFRYEQSIYFGYTGSGGTNVPDDSKQLLRELKKLSSPVAKKGK